MRKFTKFIYGILAVLIVIAACIFSYFFGVRQGIKNGGLMMSLNDMMYYSEFYEEQYSNADCEGVKEALTDNILMREKYKDIEESFFGRDIYLTEKMFSYTRLSIIENLSGNKKTSREHMDVAIEVCNARNSAIKNRPGNEQASDKNISNSPESINECTAEKLLYLQRKVDEKNPIACLSDKK